MYQRRKASTTLPSPAAEAASNDGGGGGDFRDGVGGFRVWGLGYAGFENAGLGIFGLTCVWSLGWLSWFRALGLFQGS